MSIFALEHPGNQWHGVFETYPSRAETWCGKNINASQFDTGNPDRLCPDCIKTQPISHRGNRARPAKG